MIAYGDGSRAVFIGGIMGGRGNGNSFSHKHVLIECAWFEPVAFGRPRVFF